MVCLGPSEPSIASLSIGGHTDGHAVHSASSMQSRPQGAQRQAGPGRHGPRGMPQNGQHPTVLAHHTEEHLARLLANSRRSTATQPSPQGLSIPAKRKVPAQSAAPKKKEAGAADMNEASDSQASTLNSSQGEEHATCVICAEQRQASVLPLFCRLQKGTCRCMH